MGKGIASRFNALDINGFNISCFASVAQEKLVLRLEDAMRVFRTTQEPVCNTYELQFNWVLGGWIDGEGPELGEIKHWRAHGESVLLIETLQNRGHLTYGETFIHFELTSDRAKLDVVARDYFLTIIGRHPLERGGGGDGDGIPMQSPRERKAG